MRILILHAINEPAALRRTTLNQSFCMPKHAPWHDYTFHAMAHDTAPLLGCEFDVIVLDTTFLCHRWIRPRALFDQLRERYNFVRRSSAVKLAFPQDDYDHAGVLDQWLADWGVHCVFTPLARFSQVLYPLTSRNADIESNLTGYVDPIDVAILSARARPLEQRTIDVGYRATNLPAQFGRAGQLKSTIGHRFMQALPEGHDLVLDISTDPTATLVGDAWLDFLGNCRFFIGSASGSSLVDADGRIKDCVLQATVSRPDASFDELEATCFPGLDGIHQMTALGPRHLEAAIAGACQILVPDEGLFPLEPGRHYIPIAPDASDIDRVLRDMHDMPRARETIDAAHALIVKGPAFGYPSYVERIEAQIAKHRARHPAGGRTSALPPATLAASSISDPSGREGVIHRALFSAELNAERRHAEQLFQENDSLVRRADALARENDRLVRRADALAQALADRDAFVERLQGELSTARVDADRAQAQAQAAVQLAAQRAGPRGALREIAGVNDFLQDPAGPARRLPLVVLYRAAKAWRRGGLRGLLRSLLRP
jgi:hypothetical protein